MGVFITQIREIVVIISLNFPSSLFVVNLLTVDKVISFVKKYVGSRRLGYILRQGKAEYMSCKFCYNGFSNDDQVFKITQLHR